MRSLGTATEDEMIAAFLLAEANSPRFGPIFVELLPTQMAILTKPSVANAAENRIRREALGVVRGFGRDAYLFAGFPRDVGYSKVIP